MQTPSEVMETTIEVGKTKAAAPLKKLILLGILAGAFIAFAAAASTMAAMNVLANSDTYGLGRFVAGAAFVGGLAMVVIAGAELFTGNMLMVAALSERKITLNSMMRNWLVVLAANIVGGLLVAWMISVTGLFHQNADLYGAMTVKIAAGKTALSFWPALMLGILCNWLVCLAVWMAFAAKTVGGKIAAIFFPITLFVIMGFEHSIANVYYIFAGLFASADVNLMAAATDIGAKTANLNLTGLFGNLVPVIAGNVLGGALFVGMIYWFVLKQGAKKSKS